jgi:4-carboxymuconolactone decarboxylase
MAKKATAAKTPTLRKEFDTPRFAAGLKLRREVLGGAYVDASVAGATDFNAPFQKLVTEFAWGDIWTRPGLDRKTRSMLNLVMLAALNRPHEFKLHVRGAVTNGVTQAELQEIFLHAAVYLGIPAALDAFRNASEVLKEMESK